MKLQKLTISNFRGLGGDKNVIDFSNSDIIFLIGQNNVGKSSFLRAYEFFVSSKQNACLEDFHNQDPSTPIIMEALLLKETDDDTDSTLEEKKGETWIDKWVDEENYVRIRKAWKTVSGTFTKETYSPIDKQWQENGFGGLHQHLTKHTPTVIAINAMENEASLNDKVNKLMQEDFLKKLKENYLSDYEKIVADISRLQGLITGSESVQKFNEELNKNFNKIFADLSLKIESESNDNIKIEDTLKKNHSIIVEKKDCERRETFTQYGHGVIRQALFNFISFLKRNDSTKKEYMILFEEPELFLHPSIAFKLRKCLYELIKDSPYQVLCATHSPLMIDVSQPHSSLVRIAKDSNEKTYTYQVGEDIFCPNTETKEWIKMINRFNPHICEAFYANKVLLVEGDTETIVYRDLLARFYPSEEIFVLNTGSKMNIPFFQKILTCFCIEHYVIHDTDVRKCGEDNTKANPAWKLNEKIWENIEDTNKNYPNLARRYVHTTNFEIAHNIKLSGNKDKPLKAYEFVKEIKIDSNVPCLNWLKDIVENKKIIHDQRYIEQQVPIIN